MDWKLNLEAQVVSGKGNLKFRSFKLLRKSTKGSEKFIVWIEHKISDISD